MTKNVTAIFKILFKKEIFLDLLIKLMTKFNKNTKYQHKTIMKTEKRQCSHNCKKS